MSDKQALRALIRSRKRACGADELRLLSERLMQKLRQHPRFAESRTVLLFHSLPDEPCTHALLDEYCVRKTLLLPVVCGDEMTAARYDGSGSLVTGAFGISEPSCAAAELPPIDLVVVPGVAFDAAGHRLGRGRGYYDRFLARLPQRPYLLGICFPFQFVPAVPAEPHDVLMDEVLTL